MNDYIKFKEIYDEIDILIENKVTSSEPMFKAWRSKTERFLLKKYGENSYEFKDFKKYSFSLKIFTFNTPDHEFVDECIAELRIIKEIFKNYLEEMKEETEDAKIKEKNKIADLKKVFIVHGHNSELKETVARLLEHQGITPIILHEQSNRGATIIEKIETNSNVQIAICLFTADDFGRNKDELKESMRARQNVVFETGYFIGRLNRENIIIISDDNIETPSDLQGILYTDSKDWKLSVLKELSDKGYPIDISKI